MESHTLYDDKKLFLLIAEGHKEAFTQLFKKYTPQLIPFICGLTKSDSTTNEIVQEIFMRVWFNREKLAVISEPETWIFRFAGIVCHAFLKQSLENKTIQTDPHKSYSGNNEVFETAQLYKLATDIHEAVKRLTPEQKKVYNLSREKGLKVLEIAEELAISPNNVRNILNSSLEFIHDFLQDKGHNL